jgi:hypothetical protein
MVKKIIYLIGALIVLFLALLLFNAIIRLAPRYQTKQSAQMYYQHLISGEFENAFIYVAYFDEFSDLEPESSYEEAEYIWVKRVQALKNQGVYLVGVERIEIFFDDCYPMGTVDVIIVENAISKHVTQRIHFAPQEGWKVQRVTSMPGTSSATAILDDAISGKIGEGRRSTYTPTKGQGFNLCLFP